jgi:hypothetical protein
MSNRNSSKQPQRPHTPDRSITKEELLVGTQRLALRLSRHLDSLEQGHEGAVDDVAAVLRTLLARGRGDDVLRRVRRAYNVPQPVVRVSISPVDDRTHVLAYGALPVPTDAGVTPPAVGPSWISLDSWVSRTALILRGANRRVSTWEQLITAYSNTLGSHLSGSIPEILARTSTIHADRMNVGEFLIHNAGLVAEDAITQLLSAIGGGSVVVPQARHRALSYAVYLSVRDTDANHPIGDIEVNVVGRPPEGETTLLKMKTQDSSRFLRLTVTRNHDDTGDVGYHYATETPDWWPLRDE